MAYPTWPDINGGSLFSIFYTSLAESFGWGSVVEHTHRQAGALTGLIVLVMTLCALLSRGVPRTWRLLAVASLLLVIGQGLLGANRVLSNSYLGAIAHALGAQVVIVILVAMVKLTSPAFGRRAAELAGGEMFRLRLWTGVALVLLFVNLFAAASLRHKQGAFEGHLVLGITTAIVILSVTRLVLTRFRAHAALARNGVRLAWLVGIQVSLGAAAWLLLLGPLAGVFGSDETRFLFQSLVATAHLLGGVLVMSVAAALWMDAGRLSRASTQESVGLVTNYYPSEGEST